MPRPRLPDDARRSEYVLVTVTPREKEELLALRAATRRSTSTLLRDAYLAAVRGTAPDWADIVPTLESTAAPTKARRRRRRRTRRAPDTSR